MHLLNCMGPFWNNVRKKLLMPNVRKIHKSIDLIRINVELRVHYPDGRWTCIPCLEPSELGFRLGSGRTPKPARTLNGLNR